ncbi:Por secretion system C-terminal sorting domain-containing protein [Reichenbachiella faecimaris]|uniref:Por secretion system C-terminal sorting domain-containing protein n=1 Tax=Reichenbachiella faecimaris TaxID=692418 RepID=A0A1W2G969_REIFA|nr:DUF4832 domain-containing protein [Reichenbachiella faecimaris]SMD32846.1 Por secretion system C-terminal sorting domain-containing protein [Reichenbachiella faecimaris]
MKKTLLLIIVFLNLINLSTQKMYGQTLKSSSYSEDLDAILNPERGFYKHTESHNGFPSVFVNSYAQLSSAQLDGFLSENISLVLRLFYIHEFANVDTISQAYQTKMQTDFDLLRQKGMKAIVRFAYSNIQDSLDLNVTPERIDGHLQSVKSILAANQDIILVVQAGLIGTWGEWYYTNNFGNAGSISAADYEKRFQVITSLLDNVPAGVAVQLRTPDYKRRYLEAIGESTSAISASEAYNPALVKARLGHHNDCVLSTPDGRVHEITIPKSDFSSLADTLFVGYRGMWDTYGTADTTLWANSTQSQLPINSDPLAQYVLGSNSISGGWDALPNLVTFVNGTVQEFKMADDGTNLYIRVAESGYLASGKLRFDILINTDENISTGWADATFWTSSGADYLIQKYLDASVTLNQHTGSGSGFTWNASSSTISSTLAYTDSFDDQGTFVTTDDISWVADDSNYVIQGGETCLPTNQNDCAKSEARLALHKYTYLNSLYQPDVLDKWETQGCLDDIENELGYRIKLNAASIQGSVAAGSKLFVSLDITNQGYAAPARLRPLYLVLRDSITSAEYSIPFESPASDVRMWLSGNTVFNESLVVPASVPTGTYKLFLNLPDASSSLASNVNYSIRFANQSTWEPTTGYNDLSLSTEVTSAGSPSVPTIVVDGSLADWSNVDAIGIGTGAVGAVKAHDIADTLFVSAAGTLGNGFNLYIDADGQSYTGYEGWSEGADYKLSADKLYRFEFDESWVEIASSITYVQNSTSFEVKIPKNLLYGLDETVKVGYENLVSEVSSGKAPSAGNLFSYALDYAVSVPRPAIAITADGSSADWAYVDPLVQTSGTLKLLKAFDDQTNIYVLVKGDLTNVTSNYDMYMNTDGSTQTGLIDPGFWSTTGLDYALLSGVIYEHDSVTSKANNGGNPNAWAWTVASASPTIQTASDSSTREIIIPKSLLNELSIGSFVDIGYRKINSGTVVHKLPASGGLARYAIETPYVEDLESLIISDDVTNLTLTVQGGVITTTYDALLDADNSAGTGYSDGASVSGADYLIQNGILYSYGGDGTSWAWNTTGVTITVTDSEIDPNISQRQISVPKSGLNLTSSGATIRLVYKSTVSFAETARLPESGMESYVTVKAYIPELETYTISDDGINIYLTVEGSNVTDTYEAFINIDNNTTTGYIDATWTTMGADYLIKDGLLYQYSGSSNEWGWTSVPSAINVINTQLTVDVNKREIAIPRVSMSTLVIDDIITSGYRNIIGIDLGAYIPGTGGMKPHTVSNSYVSDLQEIVITDDQDSVYITVKGGNLASTYDLFINSDENATTGYYVPAWDASGADLLVQNGTLYDYSGTSNGWGWTGSANSVAIQDTDLGGGLHQRKISVPRAAIASTTLTVSVGYGNTSGGNIVAQLPADGDMLAYVLTPLELTIGEVGKITNDQVDGSEWTSVSLTNTYTNPVVIMSPLSYENGQPATLRVKDVTSSSFKYQIDEWDYLNGSHSEENFFYLVVEAGVYELDGGVTLQAGATSSDDDWASVAFTESFSTTPLVFAQTVTYNDAAALTTRIRWIDNEAFDLKVQEEEGSDNEHALETVAWLALSEGVGNIGRTYEVNGTSRNYDHIFFEKYLTNTYDDPLLFAHMQTSYGSDACALRYDNLDEDVVEFKVEEEKSADFETNHTNEEIGFFVLDSAGVIKGKQVYQAGARIKISGTISVEQEVIESTFEYNTYPNPVFDNLNIAYQINQEGSVSIEIYGLDGQKHFSQSEVFVEGHYARSIAISHVPKGIAILRIQAHGKVYTHKLLVK